MISRSETSVIGRIIKTHGINGEVVVNIDCDIDVAELSCIILVNRASYIFNIITNIFIIL